MNNICAHCFKEIGDSDKVECPNCNNVYHSDCSVVVFDMCCDCGVELCPDCMLECDGCMIDLCSNCENDGYCAECCSEEEEEEEEEDNFMGHTCDDCKHEKLESSDIPCSDCDHYEFWNAKENLE